jgi:hypothetical protein
LRMVLAAVDQHGLDVVVQWLVREGRLPPEGPTGRSRIGVSTRRSRTVGRPVSRAPLRSRRPRQGL